MSIELSNSENEKVIRHPILDDKVKTMKIIANPVYDKLTVSRAAQLHKSQSTKYCNRLELLSRPKSTSRLSRVKSLSTDETSIKPLLTNHNSEQSHWTTTTTESQKPSQSRPITPSATNDMISTSRPVSVHSHSTQTPYMKDERKAVTDNSIRYVNSPLGFEVHRYSADNWLSVDILTKDACEPQERTFREIIEKKEHDEFLSHSIFTADYYRQRWSDLVQTSKQGTMTHTEWAEKNYQLYCLKTYYNKAMEREKSRIELKEQNQRRKRAQKAYKQWKDAKHDDSLCRSRSRLATANSSSPLDYTHSISNNSSCLIPNETSHERPSPTMDQENLQSSPMQRPDSAKLAENKFYMLDKSRWSLDAMLKRIVGLAEPLPPAPSTIPNHQNISPIGQATNGGFASAV